MTGGPVHVALATDHAYLPWCATAVLSCLRTADCGVVVHLVHAADVGPGERDRFRAMVEAEGGELRLLAVDDLDVGWLPPAVAGFGGAVSCARLVLPEVLTDVDRLLYLDADTLVLRAVGELYRAPLQGRPVGAVRNVVEAAAADRLRSLGADPQRYLNSGVLLMDLEELRRRGTAAALTACVRERGDRLLWVDQDALNLVLGDDWHELPPRWNAQNSLWSWTSEAVEVFGVDAVADATRAPAVLHFEGPWLCKPWHYLCTHPWADEYRRTLAETPWGGAPLTDRTPVTRAIRRLPQRRQVDAYVRLVRLRRRLGRHG